MLEKIVIEGNQTDGWVAYLNGDRSVRYRSNHSPAEAVGRAMMNHQGYSGVRVCYSWEEHLKENKEPDYRWEEIVATERELNPHKYGVPIPKSEDF